MTNLTKLATLAATTFVLTTTFATAMSIPTTAPGPIPTADSARRPLQGKTFAGIVPER